MEVDRPLAQGELMQLSADLERSQLGERPEAINYAQVAARAANDGQEAFLLKVFLGRHSKDQLPLDTWKRVQAALPRYNMDNVLDRGIPSNHTLARSTGYIFQAAVRFGLIEPMFEEGMAYYRQVVANIGQDLGVPLRAWGQDEVSFSLVGFHIPAQLSRHDPSRIMRMVEKHHPAIEGMWQILDGSEYRFRMRTDALRITLQVNGAFLEEMRRYPGAERYELWGPLGRLQFWNGTARRRDFAFTDRRRAQWGPTPPRGAPGTPSALPAGTPRPPPKAATAPSSSLAGVKALTGAPPAPAAPTSANPLAGPPAPAPPTVGSLANLAVAPPRETQVPPRKVCCDCHESPCACSSSPPATPSSSASVPGAPAVLGCLTRQEHAEQEDLRKMEGYRWRQEQRLEDKQQQQQQGPSTSSAPAPQSGDGEWRTQRHRGGRRRSRSPVQRTPKSETPKRRHQGSSEKKKSPKRYRHRHDDRPRESGRGRHNSGGGGPGASSSGRGRHNSGGSGVGTSSSGRRDDRKRHQSVGGRPQPNRSNRGNPNMLPLPPRGVRSPPPPSPATTTTTTTTTTNTTPATTKTTSAAKSPPAK